MKIVPVTGVRFREEYGVNVAVLIPSVENTISFHTVSEMNPLNTVLKTVFPSSVRVRAIESIFSGRFMVAPIRTTLPTVSIMEELSIFHLDVWRSNFTEVFTGSSGSAGITQRNNKGSVANNTEEMRSDHFWRTIIISFREDIKYSNHFSRFISYEERSYY